VKQEYLSKLILFCEASLRRAIDEFVEHYHTERNHQGKDNLLLFPTKNKMDSGARDRSTAANAEAVCSNTTAAPHEYFDSTGVNRPFFSKEGLMLRFQPTCLVSPWRYWVIYSAGLVVLAWVTDGAGPKT